MNLTRPVTQTVSDKKRYCKFAREEGITAHVLHVGDMLLRKAGGSLENSYVGSIFRVDAVHANIVYMTQMLPGYYDTSSYPADMPFDLKNTRRQVWLPFPENQFFRVTKAHWDTHLQYILNERTKAIDNYNAYTLKYRENRPWIEGGTLTRPFTHVPLCHSEGKWEVTADKYHDVIIALVRYGKIRGIKTLRDAVGGHTQMSLKAAKEIVETIDAGMGNISRATGDVLENFTNKLTQAVKSGIISEQQYVDIAKSVANS